MTRRDASPRGRGRRTRSSGAPARRQPSARRASPASPRRSRRAAPVPLPVRAGDPGDVERQLREIERGSGTGQLDFGGGVALRVSHLGKPYFPEAGITKGALMRYYVRVAPVLLPELADRPLVLKRYPDGVDGPLFFQQNAGAHVPDVVRVEMLEAEGQGRQPRIVGGDLPTLLYTVQLGALEVHPWLSRVGRIDTPDRCLIDLDPGVGVPFSATVSLARLVMRLLEECGLPAAVKTTGSRGIHVVLPLPSGISYPKSAELARLVAEAVVAYRSEGATTERSIRARPAGSVYVDAMQNARGKSMATAYSVRAKADASVSAPLLERELTARLRLSRFTVATMPRRVARVGDVWGQALAAAPTKAAVSRAVRALERVVEEASSAERPRR